MDITSVIADLRNQRDDLSQAILALEHLTISQPKRRGRPPKSHLAKAASIKDVPSQLAMTAGSAPDVEQAFDAHWHEGGKG